jgi:hypothetical protein
MIRVSADGGAYEVFAEGGSTGSAIASFITAGHFFVFRLFSVASQRPLATVIVTRR